MNYSDYADLNADPNVNFSQVVDASGRVVQGAFLDQFSTTNFASWSYFDERLRDLLSQSAFIARFHTVQFRQFDAAIQTLYTESTVENAETFSTTTDWSEMLSNTMYMIANINTRMNLLNAGISSLFESSNVFSESTFTLNYLSATYWPRGETWTEQWVPAQLTDNPLDFENATFMGDTLEVDVARHTITADFTDLPLDAVVETHFTEDLSTLTGNTIVAVNVTNLTTTEPYPGGYVWQIRMYDNSGNYLSASKAYLNNVDVTGQLIDNTMYLEYIQELSITSDFNIVLEAEINSEVYPLSITIDAYRNE
jgi:hypothetical protein